DHAHAGAGVPADDRLCAGRRRYRLPHPARLPLRGDGVLLRRRGPQHHRAPQPAEEAAMTAGSVASRTGKLLTPARLVMLTFLFQSAEVNNWFPRIPDIKANLGITDGQLAIALLGMPLGGFLGTLIVARVIDRLTARGTIMIAFVAFTIVQLLPGWSWNGASL